ncbi:histidine phosphatase family protein [Streptococcus cuniculi]|uniref:Histidine phosphatase family protein n=1 Tax=Streptococcus cuniculi TaxID=1432788 RepID=A0A1Q8E6M7_9STRE|nr:histidine phosphatase family protein [Streptococcus cuniculi]OLF47441.1 histidine phosphatase family protein [Streptococcus cuniculi]
MTTVYFVRHCEPNYNNHDDLTRELSPKGLQDCQLVTDFLSDKEVDIVLSSPLKRTIDTLKPFAQSQNLTIETVADFRERKIDDVWIEDFDSFTAKQWEDFSFKLENGESLQEVQNRNIAALQKCLQDYSEKTIVIGSHGTALSTILHYYSENFGLNDFLRIKPLMPHIVCLEFDEFTLLSLKEYTLYKG